MEKLYYGQKMICFSPSGNCFIELERRIAQTRNPRSLTFNRDNIHLPFTTFCIFHSILKSPDDNPFDDMQELVNTRFNGFENINKGNFKSLLLKYTITKKGETLFIPAENENDDISGIITYDISDAPEISDEEIEEVLLDMVDDWNDYINETEYCYITIKDNMMNEVDTFVANINDKGDFYNDIVYAGESIGLNLTDVAYQQFYKDGEQPSQNNSFTSRRVARAVYGVDEMYNPYAE